MQVSGTSFVWCTNLRHLDLQSHIGVLETTLENQTALLMGLEYLIGISYVDDTEVFKVCMLTPLINASLRIQLLACFRLS